MARRKKTPETSKITRVSTVAYARKQKAGGGEGDLPDEDAAPAAPIEGAAPAAPIEAAAPAESAAPVLDDKFDVTDRSQPMRAASAPAAEPAPASTRQATAMMPAIAPVGAPPAMPSAPVPPSARAPLADAVEAPTLMPGPKDVPAGAPDDPAAAPGAVPPGDSRSLRRRDATTYEFALIYRRATFIITRFGLVGTRGQWRVVEYPTSAAASHAYAKECSRFVSDGFSDYRD